MGKKIDTNLPKIAEVEKYEMLSSIFHSLYTEIKTFSAKKPDEPLNKFKVGSINRVLEQIKGLLSSQPTVGFLDILDEAAIPSNSDAVVILAQYDASLTHYKDRFHRYDRSRAAHRWDTQEDPI
jgi:hypothetical protein